MTLVVRHCGDALYVINDESLVVGHIVDVTTRVVAMLVVNICGLAATHHIMTEKMRLVDHVLEGYPVA